MKFVQNLLIIGILLACGFAYADDEKEAKIHYKKGMSLFNEQKYVEAEGEFKEAYNISGKSGLLYNLGVCNEKIPDKEKAIAYFQLYLEELPDASDSEDVKKRIEILKKPDIASPPEKETEENSAPDNLQPDNSDPDYENSDKTDEKLKKTELKTEPDKNQNQVLEIIDEEQIKKDKNKKIAMGVLISSGSLITASGFLTSIAAYNKYHTFETVCAPDCTEEDKKEVRSISIAADIQIALGLATLTGGLIWYFVERKKGKKKGGEKITVADKKIRLHPSIDWLSDWTSISITGSF
ncbi:MAG: hypothetical protein JXR91_17105 [Deltaproteobacteria bacterium]|nr:hypothetical protein [Deltaproteobacteria bacterium]